MIQYQKIMGVLIFSENHGCPDVLSDVLSVK